jgi:hypothetical protein
MSKEIKESILNYLKFERDERIPELIEAYDGDVEYVINEVWGPLETILDGKTDEELIEIINDNLDEPEFEEKFNKFKKHMGEGWDEEELYCNYIWENITNP